jgi:citrate lyase subunit beta/citryl-CoA lyase
MVNSNLAVCGNKGKGVRSDVFVNLTLGNAGGIDIQLTSKVNVMYGESIRQLAREILDFYDIKHATLILEDTGALPFVLAARIEAAIKQILPSEKEFLPEMLKEHCYATEKDKNRFSRLYLPGNSPTLMINAGIHKPDGIILDLEDAVAPEKKKKPNTLSGMHCVRSIFTVPRKWCVSIKCHAGWKIFLSSFPIMSTSS